MTTNASSPTFFSVTPSPIGSLLLVGRFDGLAGIYMENHIGGPPRDPAWLADDARFATVRAQLDDYFAGRRTSFDLPLSLAGTSFQRRVWTALQAIPFGETVSYGELARRVGAPGSARAVGHCNARNPVSVVVPCHRVIGADGSLTGYAGGEARKRWLLDWETGVRGRAASRVA